jgi:hypothetical protein
MGIDGSWIEEDHFFLCKEGDGDWSLSSDTMRVIGPDGQGCLGFKAETIALLLGLSVNQLFGLNRTRNLELHGRSVPPSSGYTYALEFTFSFERRRATLTVNGTIFSGHA